MIVFYHLRILLIIVKKIVDNAVLFVCDQGIQMYVLSAFEYIALHKGIGFLQPCDQLLGLHSL